jgi:hypothetical protein
MASIVLELQRDALDRGVTVPDLLRKALVVARKLRLAEFEAWIKDELNGYPAENEKIPPYRHLRGEVKAWNPLRGWQPVIFENPAHVDRLSTRATMQPISEIQNMVDKQDEGDLIAIPYDAASERAIQQGIRFNTRVMVFVPPGAMAGILDTVRTTVLNWALELEESGVRGDDMSFTEQDRKVAAQVSHVTNLFLGPVQSAQIQQASPEAIQVNVEGAINLDRLREVLAQLKEHLAALDLTVEQRATIAADVATIEAQAASPTPKPSILRESLGSIRRVLESGVGGAGGALLAAAITRLLAG